MFFITRASYFLPLWFVLAIPLWGQPALTASLPLYQQSQENSTDWLINGSQYKADIYTNATGDIVLSNGLIARTIRLSPNGATIGLDNLITNESVLRGVKPEAVVMIDSIRYEIGGLKGQPNYAYLAPAWRDSLYTDKASFQLDNFYSGMPAPRMGWKRSRHHDTTAVWPPAGRYLRMDYVHPDLQDVQVSIHYELYDGIPAYSKWLTVHNGRDLPINIDTFTSEILAAVEAASWVESRGVPMPTPNLHVETDYSFGGMRPENASRLSVHWVEDPDFSTQVNYLRTTPALLEVRPTVGPDQTVAPQDTFESFRAFVLVYDSHDKERKGLAQRRFYRTIAPWVTENPIMMHVRFADWENVKRAIDQAADVGFEMVILTFGSGFDIEDTSPEYRAEMERYAAYAQSKGVELGGYSLLSSRRIEPDEDNTRNPETGKPGGQTHNFSPALASPWGQAYFDNLYDFYTTSGFTLLEHDGSYPGDLDAASRPPLQKGVHDSRWVQWRIISDFYKWSLEQGIYLNVPDWYFLVGSTKVAMGYREVNWSLPRAQQVIHTRQNIYDGTWSKTPSMGWMFVPLTEYHGGGAAATIEPLDEHLDHYEKMLSSNMAMGVQSAYRGPRLYDTERTRRMVKKWVDWYKTYRDILESDMIHGRRADGKDIDWMLHVNPKLEHRGMLVVFNPLPERIEKTLSVPLYYTGLEYNAAVHHEGGDPSSFTLQRDYAIDLPVSVPANGMTWYTITAPSNSTPANEWHTLSESDFAPVNGYEDTWQWRDSILYSTGEPIGVMRTTKTYKNFEMEVEWRHLKSGGNSGVFAWVPMKALETLQPGELPGYGIEIQMLDHGYKDLYRERTGQEGDWFSTHGDIFPVGQSKLTPFPPTSPNGIRSFPSKELSKGHGEWNHYYVRAINGEIRLMGKRRRSIRRHRRPTRRRLSMHGSRRVTD